MRAFYATMGNMEAAVICGLFFRRPTGVLWTYTTRAGKPEASDVLLFNRRRLFADRVKLGRWGEKRSERFLKGKGFKTLTRNFSCRTGELDLVMVDPDGVIVFVEVKTRTRERFVPTEAVITAPKRRRIARAARYFLARHDIQDRICRYDVVTIVVGDSGRPEIRHYENAFSP